MSYYQGDYYQGDLFRNIGRAIKKGVKDIGKQVKRSTRDVGKIAKAAAPLAAFVPGVGVAGLAAGLVAKGAKVASTVKKAQAAANAFKQLGSQTTTQMMSNAQPELFAALTHPAAPTLAAYGPEHPTEGTTAPAGSSGTTQATKAIKKARRRSYKRRTTAKRKSTRRRRTTRKPRKRRTRSRRY